MSQSPLSSSRVKACAQRVRCVHKQERRRIHVADEYSCVSGVPRLVFVQSAQALRTLRCFGLAVRLRVTILAN